MKSEDLLNMKNTNRKNKVEMVFAKKLKFLRNEKGLSQTEFGKFIGVHYTHVSRYERGMGLPSIEVIMRIATKLKTSVDYLLFENDDNIVNATIQDRELLEVFSIFDRMEKKDIEYIKKVLQALLLQHQINNPILKNKKII